MLSITQFEDFSSTKRDNYEMRDKDKKFYSNLLKKGYDSIQKSKSSKSLKLLINEPYFCLEQKYLYLILISSSPKHEEKRMAIRNTWGNLNVLNNSHGAIIFLLGKHTNNMRLQKQLYEESMNYRDIIQGDFIDSFRNLTRKSIMGLKWFSSYCSMVKFLIKTDDDAFVNTEKLSKYLLENQSKKRWIVGCVKNHPTFPVKHSKDIPALSFPYGHPTYVSGTSYVMTNDIVELLYKKSQQLKLIPMEDVFITGYCAKSLGLIPEHNSQFSCGDAVRDLCTLGHSMFSGNHITAEKQEVIWNVIQDVKRCKTGEKISMS